MSRGATKICFRRVNAVSGNNVLFLSAPIDRGTVLSSLPLRRPINSVIRPSHIPGLNGELSAALVMVVLYAKDIRIGFP